MFFLCVVSVSFAQTRDTIPWIQDQKLTWKDFREKPQLGSKAAAITASGISYSFTSLARGNAVEADFKVGAFFYPNKSWYRTHLADAHILGHEQLHFDISELFARKMRKRLSEITFSLKIKTEVRKIYKDILKELNDYQELYDWETDFSRNPEKQLEWELKVVKDLTLEKI